MAFCIFPAVPSLQTLISSGGETQMNPPWESITLQGVHPTAALAETARSSLWVLVGGAVVLCIAAAQGHFYGPG